MNRDYEIMTKPIIERLQQLRNEGKNTATGIIGQSLLKEDLFFCASVNRCMHLIDGFIIMLNERNLTCAGALLWLQLDNCMRTYAAFIAENKEDVIGCVLDGNRIDKLKSKDGHFLRDAYLKEQLNKVDSRFADVYNSMSGYIHFSDKAFYETVINSDKDILEMEIGLSLPPKCNSVMVEVGYMFIHFVELHYKMLSAVVASKQRFEQGLSE